MPALNVLGTDPNFQMASLTAAVQKIKPQPKLISDLGLFTERSITTLDMLVEERDGVLSLLDVSERGAPPAQLETSKRTVRSFRLPHIKVNDRILADQIIGVRAFGSETEQETVAKILEQRLSPMRDSVEFTIESHRLAAIMGSYANAGGDFPSLFTEFGVSQQTVNFALTTATTDLKGKCLDARKKAVEALGGSAFQGMYALCGFEFFKSLQSHAKFEDTYLGTPQAADLRGDPSRPLDFGNVRWFLYEGTTEVSVPDDEAYLIPRNVPGLFITAFGPADYMDAVGRPGERIYANQWPLEANRGIQLEVQSNPLSICTRPAAVIKLTRSA